MKVELFYSPGCSQCAVVREDLKATAERTVAGIEWRELSVLEDLDYAVELGVLSLPAIAVTHTPSTSRRSYPPQHDEELRWKPMHSDRRLSMRV